MGGAASSSVARRPEVSSATPAVTSSGRSDPSSTLPSVSIARWSDALFSANFEKSWLKAVWITPSAAAAPMRRLSRSSSDPRWT